jgi:raffinose/stachyose/melibiose transport system substrate-binding protein
MRVDGSWFSGSVTKPNTTTVVPFPAYSSSGKDPSDIISGFSSGFYITKKAWNDPAKRAAAVNFVETLSSTAAITDFVNAGGGTPATAIKSDTKASLLSQAAIKMGSAAKNMDTAMDSRLSKDCYSVFIGDAAALAAGKISPTAVLKAAIAKNK